MSGHEPQRGARYDQYEGGAKPDETRHDRAPRTNNAIIVILALILVAIVAVGVLVVGAIALFLRAPGSLKESSSTTSPTETTAAPTATTPQCPPSTSWDAYRGVCAPLAATTTIPSATPQETEADRIHAAQEAARRAKQAKVDAQSRECAKFEKNPNAYLHASETRYYDRGIVRSYRQLTALRITNQAKYCVAFDIRGTVEWFDANGSSLGTTNFSVDRTVNAGDSEAFSTASGSLTSGTIAGAATSGNVTFSSASVGYMCLQPDNDCPKGMFCGQPGYCMSLIK